MRTPLMTPAEARSQQTFSALMWALSYPGRPQPIAETGLAAFAAIGAALLDLETSYYTNHPELASMLARSGSRPLPPSQAQYQLYPELTVEAMYGLAAAPVGTYTDPDASATLVIGCALGAGPRLRLSGPGVAEPVTLAVSGPLVALWELRALACNPPLGWDLVLVARNQIVGLPRSTKVEVL
ncbi:MAG: phosphonate C-P lyase system protein PhnH [Chloroflexales bacterium]|nr:phosphonate C-P lyase system protein PhnH [Chloroflexales bacterium]